MGIAASLKSRYTAHTSLVESEAGSQMDGNDHFPQHFCIVPSSKVSQLMKNECEWHLHIHIHGSKCTTLYT